MQIFFAIGAAAGILGLLWLIISWALNRPKIKVTADIIYENEAPKSVNIKAINTARTSVHILRAGFILSDNKFLAYPDLGMLQGWVHRGGNPVEAIFEYDALKKVLREANKLMEVNIRIKYACFVAEKGKRFTGDVPVDLNKLIFNE